MVQEIVGVLGWFCVHVMAALSYLGVGAPDGHRERVHPAARVSSSCRTRARCRTPPSRRALQRAVRRRRSRLQSPPRGHRGRPRLQPRQRGRLLGRRQGRAARHRALRALPAHLEARARPRRPWFANRGEIIILLARLLPVVRTFIAFPAGRRADEPRQVPRLHVHRLAALVPRARLRRAAARARAARRALAAQELHAPVRRGHRPRHHRRPASTSSGRASRSTASTSWTAAVSALRG